MGIKVTTYEELEDLVKKGYQTFAQINKNEPYVLFHKLRIEDVSAVAFVEDREPDEEIMTDEYYPDGNLKGNINNPPDRMEFWCSFSGEPNRSGAFIDYNNFGSSYFETYEVGQKVIYSGIKGHYNITVQ